MAKAWRGDPNAITEGGITRLQRAILQNDTALISRLLQDGANPDFKGDMVYPPLHFALDRDRHHAALLLIEAKADINLQDHRGRTPLHIAVAQSQESFVLALLKAGADPNIRDEDGKTPLHLVTTARPDMIEALVRHQARIDEQDDAGNTPLHLFVGKPQMVEKFLENGADPNICNDEGRSPYMMMLEDDLFQKYQKNVQQMISFRADLGATNKLGETVLHLAGRLEMEDTFATLITSMDLKVHDAGGNNVLHALVRTLNARMIDCVLDKVPELVNEENHLGRTPLSELTRRADRLPHQMSEKFLATAQTLIFAGASLNVYDEENRSLLHHAIHQRHDDFACLLIDRGIALDHRDVQGKAALHVAIERNNMMLLDYLLDHGADPDLTDERGWTVLDRLAEKNDRDSPVVQRLIVAGGQYVKQLPLNPDLMRAKRGPAEETAKPERKTMTIKPSTIRKPS